MVEIFINNSQVDVGTAPITLQYTSNIFSSFDKITSNRSYTITLPATRKNDNIFSQARRIMRSQSMGYTTFDFVYKKDGILIITDGVGYLTSAGDDGYNVTVVWGLISGLKNLIEEGVKLSDVWLGNKGVELVRSPTNTAVGWSGWGYCDYDYSSRINKATVVPDTLPYRLPCWRGYAVIDYVKDTYGLSFTASDEVLTKLNDFVVPFVSWNENNDPEDVSINIVATVVDLGYETVVTRSITLGDEYYYVTKYEAGGQILTAVNNRRQGTYSGEIYAYHSTAFVLNVPTLTGTLTYNSVYNATNLRHEIRQNATWDIGGTWVPSAWEQSSGSLFWSGFNFTFTGSFEPTDTQEVAVDSFYSFKDNVPDMSVVDFLKEMFVRVGVFAMSSSIANTIRLVTIAELEAKTQKNWSGRLLSGGEVVYSVDGYAQNNYMQHIEDSESIAENGNIVVGNTALEYETTIFESKFSTDKKGGYSVPIYAGDGEGSSTKTSISPRLMRVSGQKLYSYTFGEVVDDNYPSLQSVLNKTKIYKGKFKVYNHEISQLTLDTPIYCSELGGLFAIISMQITDEIAEVEFLKIK